VLLFLSLISYESAPPGVETGNLIGPVGQRAAEILLALTGIVSYVWLGVFAVMAVGLFSGNLVRLPARRLLAACGCLLVMGVLIHLFMSPTRVHGFPPAGALASWSGEISRALFDDVGSIIIYTTLFVALFAMAINRSISVMARLVAMSARNFLSGNKEPASTDDKSVATAPTELRKALNADPVIETYRAIEETDAGLGETEVSRPDYSSSQISADKGPGVGKLKGLWKRFRKKSEPAPKEAAPKPRGAEPVDESAGSVSPAGEPFFDMFDGIHTDTELEALVTLEEDPMGMDVEILPTDTTPHQIVNPVEDWEKEVAEVTEAIEDTSGDEVQALPKVVSSDAMSKQPDEVMSAQNQELPLARTPYNLPAVSLLDYDAPKGRDIDEEVLQKNAAVLVEKLKDFGVECEVVKIRPGPVITMYEIRPARGVKIAKITTLTDDLAMAVRAEQIRIVAPIPGRDVVGIEIPNRAREIVYLKEIIASEEFQKHKGNLPLAIGKDIFGQPCVADLGKMPHLLVAGATGAGKSVGINTFIVSLLYRHTPAELRMLMVDPKMLELSIYDGIPHLLMPVLTDAKRATIALRWAVKEMERRYALLKPVGVRNISGYNKHVEKIRKKASRKADTSQLPEPMPHLVVIIDELADLMMVAGKDVESSIARLAQMARAAGIHLIVATQRPSVDVITGLIKANFPTRMSFRVSSKVDSRTILDSMGAERLLGMGDMLFLPPGSSHLNRIHGGYVSDEEVQRIVEYAKSQGSPRYDQRIIDAIEAAEESDSPSGSGSDNLDPLYDQAVAVIAQSGRASISYLQRQLEVGYNRASRIMEQMEAQGVVGPQVGSKPREILVQP